MAKIGQKTWITEIRPAVRTDLYWSSSIIRPMHDPLPTAAQPSLGYAFYDMAVLVLALLTDATNLYKMQMQRSVNTMFLYCCCVFIQKGI